MDCTGSDASKTSEQKPSMVKEIIEKGVRNEEKELDNDDQPESLEKSNKKKRAEKI
ncbi:MAG: hypothetical protein ABSD71_12245 [Bacteroidales bacterium]|jgi:hypothetical protein